MFICFEGIDGCGKSTQVKLLKKHFEKKGKKVLLTKFPSKNKIGKLIKSTIINNVSDSKIDALLFLADMIMEDELIIKKALKKGFIVISDRYYYSTIVYQGIQGVSVKCLKSFINNLSKPDFVFIIKISASIGLKRKSSKGSKYEKLSMLNKASRKYNSLKSLFGEKIVKIDGNKSKESVHNIVVKKL